MEWRGGQGRSKAKTKQGGERNSTGLNPQQKQQHGSGPGPLLLAAAGRDQVPPVPGRGAVRRVRGAAVVRGERDPVLPERAPARGVCGARRRLGRVRHPGPRVAPETGRWCGRGRRRWRRRRRRGEEAQGRQALRPPRRRALPRGPAARPPTPGPRRRTPRRDRRT